MTFCVFSRWAYTCVDMKALILERHPEIRNAFLKQITIYGYDLDVFFVDNIAIFRGSMNDRQEGNLLCYSHGLVYVYLQRLI